MVKEHTQEAVVGVFGVTNVTTYSSPHTFAKSNIQAEQATFRPSHIEIVSSSSDGLELQFDMIGTCAPIANTIRRVMMEDVPTMAIETVDFVTNTSVIQDENLASRLGLIPIYANPKLFDYPQEEDWTSNYKQCLKFVLNVTGTKDNQLVLSSELQWVPMGNQQSWFKDSTPRAVQGDIVIAKIKDGQCIVANLYACKGSGSYHAKYSPVCPVSYKMFPKVYLCDPKGNPTTIEGEEAQQIKDLCPGNVFDIEDGHLAVKRERNCTMCRECIREGERSELIRLARKKDHFMFSVESTGVYTAKEIVREALVLFQWKCDDLKQVIDRTPINKPMNATVETDEMEYEE
eukprot:NODE_4924_length_1094_cov_60.009269_g4376_i0.p1 GENE.NODE_4924_length_1094_cov_60.009269_g4376_i0~~NODE_4924_length_1094_cov_60.009269_g4376_i0.p1  ORF type:complete len:346 (+),score=75.55 NODE_4924_length_1094_cov_60.009269_g4376_i0:51-1088(+)